MGRGQGGARRGGPGRAPADDPRPRARGQADGGRALEARGDGRPDAGHPGGARARPLHRRGRQVGHRQGGAGRRAHRLHRHLVDRRRHPALDGAVPSVRRVRRGRAVPGLRQEAAGLPREHDGGPRREPPRADELQEGALRAVRRGHVSAQLREASFPEGPRRPRHGPGRLHPLQEGVLGGRFPDGRPLRRVCLRGAAGADPAQGIDHRRVVQEHAQRAQARPRLPSL
mmetsp:Transcript_85102/g.255070  ORF Transcript_85102/g.255070 Transcript_85102/m.255070 type:complete len:228 (+) Transcript_85102:600-1283(+)